MLHNLIANKNFILYYKIIINKDNMYHFFLAAAFLASFLPFPAGALSAASFSLAFLSASIAYFLSLIFYSFFLTVSASILMVVWQRPQ